jgi:formylmethanofuran dehydrogenase subunit E
MNIQLFLEQSAARHSHLCPRQVLGVRIGLLATRIFDLPPGGNPGKRLFTIIESDGCFSDGIEVATGCTLGHRRLRLEDYGKIAATFIDTITGRAVRIAPKLDIRQKAYAYAPDEPRRYFAQLRAYQIMPDETMFTIAPVILTTPIEAILSRPGMRVNCDSCGEEIINEREIKENGLTLCRTCAGDSYYQIDLTAILKGENIPSVLLNSL